MTIIKGRIKDKSGNIYYIETESSLIHYNKITLDKLLSKLFILDPNNQDPNNPLYITNIDLSNQTNTKDIFVKNPNDNTKLVLKLSTESDNILEYKNDGLFATPSKTAAKFIYKNEAPAISHNIIHNLNTMDLIIEVYIKNNLNYEKIITDIIINNENSIVINLDYAAIIKVLIL